MVLLRFGVAAVLAALVCVPGPATAAEQGASGVSVLEAWARATPKGANAGAAYVTIEAAADAGDRLTGVSTPGAGKAEIHTHIQDGDVMKMRRLEALEIPAASVVRMAPGGDHIMLLDLKAPLVEGGTLPLTLEFEKAGKIEAVAKIEAVGASGARGDTGSGPGSGSGSGSGSGAGSDSGSGSGSGSGQ